MSSAGGKEVLGAIEIVVGEAINYYTGGTGGNWLVQMGIATMVAGGLQELTNLLAPSPMPSAQNGIIRSTVANQQRIYGQVKTGGVIAFSDSFGSNNEYLVVAVTHSLTRKNGSAGMAVQGVEAFYINDVEIPVNTGSGGWNSSDGSITSSGVGQPYDALAGNLWIYFHDGSQTAVDTTISSNFTYWDTAAVGKGICYSVFKMFNSSDAATFKAAYPQGIPNMLGLVMSGQKVYDPRLDSTNGGSGSQRLATPSTWTFSSNPALIAADYLTTPKLDGGCGFSTSQVDWADVAAAANVCDEDLTIPAYGATWGGSSWSSTIIIARYTCNMALDLGVNCDQNLRLILDCMAGFVVVQGNMIRLFAGTDGTSSGDVDDTFLAGPATYTTETVRQSRWNAVKATYGQDPACDYQQQAAAPIYNSTYETEDGGVRLIKSITLPGVTNQFAAQYISIIESQRSRNSRLLSLKCNLKMLQYEVNDIVTVTISALGISSVNFRITGFTLSADLSIDCILQEEISGTYTVTPAGSEYTAFDPPSLTTLGNAPGAPDAPTSPKANSVGAGILVQWTPPAPNYYAYIEVWRAPDVSGSPGTFSLIAKVLGDSYIDNAAGSKRTWWYKMRAVNYWAQSSGYTSNVSASAVYVVKSVGAPAGQRILSNGNFEHASTFDIDGAPPGWTNGPGAAGNPVSTPTTVAYETSAPYDGARSIHLTCSGQYQGIGQAVSFDVTPGDVFYVSGILKTGGGTEKAEAGLYFFDSSGASTGSVVIDSAVGSTTYTAFTNTGVVPANSAVGYFALQNVNAGSADIWGDDFVCLRVADPSANDLAMKGSVPPTNPTTAFTYQSFTSIGGWPANTTLPLGSMITVSGRTLILTSSGGGVTGSSAPSWNLAFGATTVDNTCLWTSLGSQANDNGVNITAFTSNFTRADGTTKTVPRQIFAILHQTGGTTVWPYLGWDEVLQEIYMYGTDGSTLSYKANYTGGINSSQSDNAVYTNRNNAINAAALQNAKTVIPLTVSGNFSISIPSSGTVSASGGGYTHAITGGYCPHGEQLVYTDQGDVPARALLEMPEAKVWTSVGWVKPLRIQADPHRDWVRIKFETAAGERIDEVVTERHSYIGHDGALVSSEDMKLGTILRGDGGGYCEVVGLEKFREDGLAVGIELPEPHTFYISKGGAESHNPLCKP